MDARKLVTLTALETPRIRLEIPSPVHVDGIHATFASDPEVTRFLEWTPARSREDSEAAMARRLARLASGEELSWILVHRETSGVFGSLSLWPRPDGVELGFALARSMWGRGLAGEAACAAIEWAHQSLQPARIWASCDLENARSSRVLAKLGMKEIEPRPASRIRPNLSPSPRGSRIFELVIDAGSDRALGRSPE